MFDRYTPEALYEHIRRDVTDTTPATPEIPASALSILAALARYDVPTYRHSLRVAGLVWDMALLVPLNRAEQERIWLAGLLHDCGKLWTPQRILRHRGTLNAADAAIVRRQSSDAATILATLPGLNHIAGLLPNHSEHGERRYVIGVTISTMQTRVLVLANDLDEMAHATPALSTTQIRHILQREAGRRWDERLAKRLVWAWPFANSAALEIAVGA